MARSAYIYLIRNIADDAVLGAFTVKHEAHTFAKEGPYDWEQCYLTRMPDGRGDKTEVEIPWEFE